MPGNTVKINNSEGMEWYVGDSQMQKVIECLDKSGLKYGRDIKRE